MKSNKIIFQSTDKTKCDVKDCKNDAQFYFAVKGIRGKFFICGHCLDKLADDVKSARVPKSPQNAIKRKIDIKQKENDR